jgi:hypothetical protein
VSGGEFQRACNGRLFSLLSWDQLTAFWQRVDAAAGSQAALVASAIP